MSKALFGLWSEIRVSQLNRLLRPYNVRLVLKTSKNWGDQVAITVEAIPVDPAPATAPPAP